MQLALQIIEFIIVAATAGYFIYFAARTVFPLFRDPALINVMFSKIAEAEKTVEGGKEKLSFVMAALLDYCEENQVSFNEYQLKRIVNLVVAAANIIKSFIKK